jgi:DNA-directed RNA polymerase subunit RPC12/RpoP
MVVPYWLLRLLPMWDYICPKCKKEVKKNSHECPHCGKKYSLTLRVPSRCLKDPKKLEEYVHNHVFPRISEFERNYLTKYFTELFSDGFETNDFSKWNATYANNGTITVETNNPHHGTHNAKADITSAGGTAEGHKTFAATPIAYERMYIKFLTLTLPAGHSLQLFSLEDISCNYSTIASVESPGGVLTWCLITIENSSAEWNLGSHTPTTNVWYCVELKRDVTNGSEILYVNGGIEASSARAITTNNSYVRAGIAYATYAPNTLVFDCVVVADAYIGPHPKPKGTIAIHAKLAGII